MDEGGHRCGSFHGIQQPGLQGELGRLASSGEKQQQADGRQRSLTRVTCLPEDVLEGDRSEGDEDEHDGQRKTHVSYSVDHERLLRCCRSTRLVLPETDQQVTREPDAFPADVQQQVVVGEHQYQHRGDEQVQVAEELASIGVVRHVAERIDVDQRANDGDQQDEDNRQLI